MCSACGYPAAAGHWTEAGADTPHDRLRERFRRVTLANRLLDGTGVSVHDDGMIPGLQVRAPGGATTIVPDLQALWAEVDRILGAPVDPLGA